MQQIMDEYRKKIAKKIDDEIYNFLEKEGYTLEKGNLEQAIQLKEKLRKEDKQVRWETCIVSQDLKEPYTIKMHGLIFFDSISNPLNKEQIKNLILKDYYKNKEVE